MTAPPGAGWGTADSGSRGRSGEHPGARRLLRRLIEVVAEPVSPQQRLDRIVKMIAANLVAEVCSVYAQRAGDVLELFATEGLATEAVHKTRMRVGEGLVGTIAAQGRVIHTDAAQEHPAFSYRPETREEIYRSFLGVPILRSGKVVGVLTVQNQAPRNYSEDEVEAMQIIGSVLAEMFASGGLIDRTKYADLSGLVPEPARVEGMRLVEGVAIGRAWLHEPRVQVGRLLADDPANEHVRIGEAMRGLQRSLDQLLESRELGVGEHREVLEAYRMFAHDSGWLRRIRDAIATGLTAEAAVRRVQDETRVRIGHVNDPLTRERLLDLDDLANRLLLHLAGRDRATEVERLPANTILVARSLSVTELIDYGRGSLAGIVLEEGSKTAHVTILARALDLPLVGRVEGVMGLIDRGDLIGLDGEHGIVFVRPGEEVIASFGRTVQSRAERKRQLAALRDEPTVSRDGLHVALFINAAFLADMVDLGEVGAEGCGLYRTELAFMTRPAYPSVRQQAELYGKVLDIAGERPVCFRTIDIGGDKHLPYWRVPAEENPAMGWRSIRIALDRPQLLRDQVRALLQAAAGRRLQLMFPMVAEVAEFDAARSLVEREMARLARHGRPSPVQVEIGTMLEVPALLFQLEALLARVDFISVGTNDLVQFLFACDRGDPVLAERFDVLSPAFLSLLRDLVEKCRECGVRLSVCGEAAGRPLEAMALVAVGVRQLSVAAVDVGSVKAMIRSLEIGTLRSYVMRLLDLPDHSLRGRLRAYALDHSVVLPPNVYQPF